MTANDISAMDNNKSIRQFSNLKILRAKLFVSIHIFQAMLQVKNYFKKTLYYNQSKKVVKPIILLSYAVSKQC